MTVKITRTRRKTYALREKDLLQALHLLFPDVPADTKIKEVIAFFGSPEEEDRYALVTTSSFHHPMKTVISGPGNKYSITSAGVEFVGGEE